MTVLTKLEVLSAADEALQAGGYRRVDHGGDHAQPLFASGGSARVYEDPYSVVAVYTYDSPDQLLHSWPDAQGEFVSALAPFLSPDEDKSWDGYLVLLALELPDPHDAEAISRVAYDTTHVRKLVATGEGLKTLSDVARALLPLLPLQAAERSEDASSNLDLLPDVLSGKGVPQEVTRLLLHAFEAQRPMITALYDIEKAQ